MGYTSCQVCGLKYRGGYARMRCPSCERRHAAMKSRISHIRSECGVEPEPRKVFKSGNSMPAWYADAWHLPPHERAKVRSRTFPGIAKAIASQWCEQIGMGGV